MKTDLEKEIERLEEKVRKLKTEKVKYDSLPRNYKFAKLLHDLMCSSNHTDGCGWFYEGLDSDPNTWNDGYVHKRFLKFAENLYIKGFDEETVFKFLETKTKCGI